jgi:hypothetical protein
MKILAAILVVLPCIAFGQRLTNGPLEILTANDWRFGVGGVINVGWSQSVNVEGTSPSGLSVWLTSTTSSVIRLNQNIPVRSIDTKVVVLAGTDQAVSRSGKPFQAPEPIIRSTETRTGPYQATFSNSFLIFTDEAGSERRCQLVNTQDGWRLRMDSNLLSPKIK